MGKVFSVLVALLIVVGVVAASCAPPAPPELKPLGLRLTEVKPIQATSDNVNYGVTFVFSNPNDFEVTLDSLNYFVATGDTKLVGSQYADDVLILPGKDAQVTVTFLFPFTNLVMGGVIMKGMAAGAASVAALPLWKSLGGNLPNPALQAVWDSATAQKLAFKVTGIAYIKGGGLSKGQAYELSYTAP